jgi:hypothetical protein
LRDLNIGRKQVNLINSENAPLIDRLVAAYNLHDARAFADCFTEDAVHGKLHAETQQHGREAIYHRYTEVFSMYPENRTEVVHRIAFGAFIIDHERVQRSATVESFDVVAIYTVRDGLIDRCEFVREQ